jgi:hypothetical protein
MADALIAEITERFDYARNAWREIRDEGAKDMKFVSGDPWDELDKQQRKNRPTVAPEEMGQYFNQVINQLLRNPRGMVFHPRGNGATEAGARFYQNKARETEYRSHAKVAYIAAAENAIQRSYGSLRLTTQFASPRSANQEIWIEDMPDPDMLLVDPDAKRPDSSDMEWAFVLQWVEQKEHQRGLGKHSIVKDFSDWRVSAPSWIQGTKVLQAEYWKLTTRKRTLVLAQIPAPTQPNRAIAPAPMAQPQYLQAFADEITLLKRQYPTLEVQKDLRDVDYPAVKQYLTNGIEVLSDPLDWAGKYIPIVTCYGKILWVPEGGEVKRKILSMTRFGRDPWKAFCYACSQELEVLGLVPKVSLGMYEGQMDATQLNNLAASLHEPRAALTFKAKTAASGEQILPPPVPIVYPVGEHLQGLQMVKESYRRSIQAAMGSNFLPTQAQKRNEKSGVALDRMDQAASTGTFHFVDHYNDLIRRTAEIFEDLCDKIYDYRGETAVIEADGKSQDVKINDPSNPEAISTKGDYAVTVSVGPSSDSESEAAAEFVDTLISQIERIAAISGPKVAAAVFAKGIRMRNLGPEGDQLADLIEPPEFKTKDGQPPSPEIMAAKGQIDHLTKLLQQAAQEKAAKVVEQKGKFQTEAMKADKDAQLELELKRMDIAGKILVARIAAADQAADRQAEADEERLALGVQVAHDTILAEKQQRHDAAQIALEHLNDHTKAAHERIHEVGMAHLKHDHATELADKALEGQIVTQQHAADLAPPPEASA